MSLDGFVAQHDDNPSEIFEWYDAGDVEVPSAHPEVRFRVDEASAGVLKALTSEVGALIAGRRLFDITDGWGDRHPGGAAVVVVTHESPEADRWPRTRFVHDVPSAVELALEIAGDRDVTIASPSIIRQALELDLVDEVHVSLAPVLFGEGIPQFAGLGRHVALDDPEIVVGRRAVHLRYVVRREERARA